ncbi:MAG TPA: hypothetical protein VMY39_02105, partial [Planctomycetota bacterium]|nr:hypothetical protein [Planctomycetota bacterium]
MADVPSMREIAEDFRRDVTLGSWRRRRRPDRPVAFTGAQKHLFDHLMSIAADCEKERAGVIAGLKSRKDVARRAVQARRVFRRVMGLAT